MNAIFIDTRRDGYTPNQCGRTMTVDELINILSGYDEDTPVYIRNDNGYTYGSINEWDVSDAEDDEEEEEEEFE